MDRYNKDKDRQRERRDDRPRPAPERPDIGNQEQVKRLKRAMERSANEVLRCQKCGHQQGAEATIVGPASTCDKCGTSLHSCRHCVHFDTGARFACRKPVQAEIGDKWAVNPCSFFEPRLVLDSTGKRLAGQPVNNNKSLFDSLFKR